MSYGTKIQEIIFMGTHFLMASRKFLFPSHFILVQGKIRYFKELFTALTSG